MTYLQTWRNRLNAADTPEKLKALYAIALPWQTCACGEKIQLENEIKEIAGSGIEKFLSETATALGSHFASAVESGNAEEALRCLENIENISEEDFWA